MWYKSKFQQNGLKRDWRNSTGPSAAITADKQDWYAGKWPVKLHWQPKIIINVYHFGKIIIQCHLSVQIAFEFTNGIQLVGRKTSNNTAPVMLVQNPMFLLCWYPLHVFAFLRTEVFLLDPCSLFTGCFSRPYLELHSSLHGKRWNLKIHKTSLTISLGFTLNSFKIQSYYTVLVNYRS